MSLFFDEWISEYIRCCQLVTNECPNIFSCLHFHEWMSEYICPCSIFTNECTNLSKWKILTKYFGKWIKMDSEDDIGDEDRGIYFNIKRWTFILPKFVWITNIILLSGFKPLYSWESNIPNKSSNIFMRRKKSQMNVRIYSRWKNPRIFKRINIFVNKYSNIFEYPNIRYTLWWSLLVEGLLSTGRTPSSLYWCSL